MTSRVLTDALVRKLRPAVRGVCVRMVRPHEVDDAEQAAWEALVIALPQWRGLDEEPAETRARLAQGGQAEVGREMGSLVNFATGVARNACSTFGRKEARRGVRYASKGTPLVSVSLDAPAHGDETGESTAGAELADEGAESALDRLIREEDEEIVRETVAELPPRERATAESWATMGRGRRRTKVPASNDTRGKLRVRTETRLREALIKKGVAA